MENYSKLLLILLCSVASSRPEDVIICKTIDSTSGVEKYSTQTVFLKGNPGPRGEKGDPGHAGLPAVINYTFITKFIEKELRRIVEANKTLPTPTQKFLSKVSQSQSSLPRIFKYWYNYDYDDGLVPVNLIRDGGNDMFDHPSNQVKIYKDSNVPSEYLTYSTSESFPSYDLSVGGTIGTYPFIAVAWINNTEGLKTQYTIKVDNNYGADGAGRTVNTSGSFKQGSIKVKYFTFQSYGTKDPTVCEVFFTFSYLGVSNTNFNFNVVKFNAFKDTQDTSEVRITGRPQNVYFGYALLSKFRRSVIGRQIPDDEITNYLRNLDINVQMFS